MAKGGKKTRKKDQGEMESSKKKTSKVKTKSKHELAKVTSIPKAVARTLGIMFSVGSVCSGLCTEVFALQSLLGDNCGVVDHTFARDSNPVAKEFARANFKHLFKKGHYYDDLTSKEFLQNAPEVDLFTAGFPCQPFSLQGLNRGEADARGQVIWYILRYLKRALPRAVMLENVPGLKARHPETLLAILKAIKGIKDAEGQPYQVRWTILDSLVHGALPQLRKRLYICAWRGGGKWPGWPSDIPARSLKSIMENLPANPMGRDRVLPTGRGSREAVLKMLKEIIAAGVNPAKADIAIDCDSSVPRYVIWHTPCLTASRGAGHGYWITRAGRKMTVPELFRLQGFDPSAINIAGGSDRQIGHMIGNAFSQTIVERVLARLLRAAALGPKKLKDRWA